MSISLTTKFKRSATEIELPIPRRGYNADYMRSQNIHRTADGAVLVYDRATSWHVAELTFRLTQTQRNALDGFVENTIEGAAETFDYTDARGNTYAGCRLLEPELSHRKTPGGLWEVRMLIETPEAIA